MAATELHDEACACFNVEGDVVKDSYRLTGRVVRLVTTNGNLGYEVPWM
jgi:hypothetical protein